MAIVVSAGKQQAKVPNVIGKLRSEAVQAMRAAGLTPTVEEEETEVPGKVGRAIDQFPPPGSEVEPGAAVTIVVGKSRRAGRTVMPAKKMRVAVLSGGRSSEHDVSLRSGRLGRPRPARGGATRSSR